MKEKIANALKTKYANLGLTEKAFGGVASILEKTIADESGIDSAISADYVSNLLKDLQSDFDKLRGEKSTALKSLEDYKKLHPETTPNPSDETAQLLREMKAKMDAMEQKSLETEKRAKKESVLADVRRKMKESGSDNDFILSIALKDIEVGDSDTVESLVGKYKTVYDDTYRQAYGDGRPPAGPVKKTEGYQKGDFSANIEALQKEGVIPKSK